MNSQAALDGVERQPAARSPMPAPRNGRKAPLPFHVTNHAMEDESGQRQAELFYLQKQIQSQTPMVVVLSNGEHVEGCIEWYDRRAIKIRGRDKVLIYKSAIKYMYKVGETGQ